MEVTSNVDGPLAGELALEPPPGWTFAAARSTTSGSRARGSGRARIRRGARERRRRGRYEIRAVARAGGRTFAEGYDTIEHRDLETRYLYRPARLEVRGVDVRTAPGLRVGYVMGVGDQVPAAITQLGAAVEMLDEDDLATGDLSGFDAIVTGTRAYGARADLRAHNAPAARLREERAAT